MDEADFLLFDDGCEAGDRCYASPPFAVGALHQGFRSLFVCAADAFCPVAFGTFGDGALFLYDEVGLTLRKPSVLCEEAYPLVVNAAASVDKLAESQLCVAEECAALGFGRFF